MGLCEGEGGRERGGSGETVRLGGAREGVASEGEGGTVRLPSRRWQGQPAQHT